MTLFPRDFVWGVATSAYQIEGAARSDGRGLSIWDVFCARPGAISDGESGDIACDHYHRYREDVALMERLGVNGYRFSVSWPRVMPAGTGAVNQQGLDFYNRLVDDLLAAGIQPMCTLFHWDLPQALYHRRGWLNRDVAGWFADYVEVVARSLSDRVKGWITQNEPQCYIGMALLDGVHAPGDKLPYPEYLAAAHNSMRAHGRAVQALRAHSGAVVGYAAAAQIAQPATEGTSDVEAARTATFSVRTRGTWNNTWWTDPVLLGRYPADGLALFGNDVPCFPSSDFDEICQPLDFLGLNIYHADAWRAGADGAPERVKLPRGYPRSAIDWQLLTPAALYWGPKYFYERYRLPVPITENGISGRDHIFLDGQVHDPQRMDYIQRALLQLRRAIADGVPVAGYYHWSLLDNFEWAEGYKQRFGLVYVDYPSLQRIPKDSFSFYQKVIATNGGALFGKTAMPAAQMMLD